MGRLDIWVEGRPVPQPRYTQRWNGQGKRLAWTPKASGIQGWKHRVALACLTARQDDWPLTCDVKMGFSFRMKARAGHRPDLDNLIKGSLDATVGILLHDDSQVRAYLEPTEIVGLQEGQSEGLALLIEY